MTTIPKQPNSPMWSRVAWHEARRISIEQEQEE